MKSQFELLAPGGDVESVKAAIAAGADAVYLGLEKFNARTRASNVSLSQLDELCHLAHRHHCKIFVTLNIMLLESELPAMVRLLNRLVNIAIDGIIAQDLGLLYLVKQHFASLDAHASTQLNTHNTGQIAFLKQFGVSRVNLARELNLDEIKQLAAYGHRHQVFMEVFVHGSYCIGFSGLCYISSVRNGCSGNRGRCSQPCRDQYQTTKMGKNYPLNLKDNSAFLNLQALADAGVYSLKVEGRMKQSHYVFSIVEQWRKQLSRFAQAKPLITDTAPLYKVFNRDFSNGYLQGEISRSMFIDHSRNHSLQHFARQQAPLSETELQQLKQSLYDDNTHIIAQMKQAIAALAKSAQPLKLELSGKLGQALKLSVYCEQQQQFCFESEQALEQAGAKPLSPESLKQLFTITHPDFSVSEFDVSQLQPGLVIPSKSLQALKQRFELVVLKLSPRVKAVDPQLALATAKPPVAQSSPPGLAVLIDDPADLSLLAIEPVDWYWQLPEALANKWKGSLNLFRANPKLLPWFPAILIGEHYQAAVEFLTALKPKLMVTNNSGIASVAKQLGLNWIAGPQLNTANSLAMAALKHDGGAAGAFVSNELKAQQLRQLKRPEDFRCLYSVYHPINLLTSRQCLFQQTVGCKKTRLDRNCLSRCSKTTSVTNLKDAAYLIHKKAGDYNRLYSQQHFLNCDIVSDLPNLFSELLIDLRAVKTETQITAQWTKAALVEAFLALVQGQPGAADTLHQVIHPTQNKQYRKGL